MRISPMQIVNSLMRSAVVAIAVPLSSLAAEASMGGNVTLYPSGWPPPYFSGTKCRIVATVYTSSPAWLTDAKVFIDGVPDMTPVF